MCLLYVPESPKWLFDNGKLKKCREVLEKMARRNESRITWVPIMQNDEDQKVGLQAPSIISESDRASKLVESKQSPSLMGDIMAEKLNLSCMVVVWIASSFCYYLISYQMKYLKGNLYVNGIISSSSEIAAYLSSGVIAKIFGIKKVLI